MSGISEDFFGSFLKETLGSCGVDLSSSRISNRPSTLAFVSLNGGIKELRRIPLPAKAATGVAALGSGKAAHILVGLEDGRVVDVRP